MVQYLYNDYYAKYIFNDIMAGKKIKQSTYKVMK